MNTPSATWFSKSVAWTLGKGALGTGGVALANVTIKYDDAIKYVTETFGCAIAVASFVSLILDVLRKWREGIDADNRRDREQLLNEIEEQTRVATLAKLRAEVQAQKEKSDK